MSVNRKYSVRRAEDIFAAVSEHLNAVALFIEEGGVKGLTPAETVVKLRPMFRRAAMHAEDAYCVAYRVHPRRIDVQTKDMFDDESQRRAG